MNHKPEPKRWLTQDALNRKNARLIACLQAATELYWNPFVDDDSTGINHETIEEGAARIARAAVQMEKILKDAVNE